MENAILMPELSEKRILVTGGAGFIGSHLVEELINLNHSVTVLDNLSSGTTKNLENIKKVNFKFVEGDISDFSIVDNLVRDCDMVFHLAEFIPTTKSFGSGHVIKFSSDEPLRDFDVSARGTLIVLNSARKYDKKFVFTSTAAVYGGAKEPLKENSPILAISPYGISKFCAEEFVRLYNRIYGLPTSIARFFNVYGPRQSKYIMYDLLLKLAKNPLKLEMLGTGDEKRDFVYVKDVVQALLLISQDRNATGDVYNIGSGKQTTIAQLTTTMLELLGATPEITFSGSSWKGDAKNLIADISKISSIGFRPQYDLVDGLNQMINWYKSIDE